ncbi:hypothetical protein, partial [Sicyoidochytrium minutum DNA virus]
VVKDNSCRAKEMEINPRYE